MERFVIVSKTRWGTNGACIGGISLQTSRSIRLLNPGGVRPSIDCEFNVGQIWELDCHPIAVTPPHVEDVVVNSAKRIAQRTNLRDFLLQRIEPWRGGPDQLYDGLLTSENQSCFIPRYITPPRVSTGFWLPDAPLYLGN